MLGHVYFYRGEPGCALIMDLNFNWWDLVVFGLIIVISYWIAFKSGASKLFERRAKVKRIRGTISGENKLKLQPKSFIKKVMVIRALKSFYNFILFYFHFNF